MGLLSSKADKVSTAAQGSWDNGMQVFVCQVTTAATGTSGNVDGWASAVQDVEAIGWRLDRMSLTEAKGWLVAVLLFRR